MKSRSTSYALKIPGSEAEPQMYRRAIKQFLPVKRKSRRGLREHPAFGLWNGKGVDGLNCQRKLRREWAS
ncbi:hypothetical protein ES703_89030 [subsurface metagenome]